MDSYGGELPDDPGELVRLPGIGPATAASICVFACNRPLPFVETNIRTVFIHFFFNNKGAVHDRDILPLVEETLDRQRPREWFYALMDYGVMLKKTVGNLNRRSRHYAKQARFEGSDRQLRGRILQLLLDHQEVTEADICGLLKEPGDRITRVTGALREEGIIVESGTGFRLD
jgi:A/G-specific adenine glycosylase